MLSGAGAQMVRDLVAGTATAVREPVGWLSFGLVPLIAYCYDRPRWMKWMAGWALIALGWWLLPRPDRQVWASSVIGVMWILLAALTHVSSAWLRLSIHGRRARRSSLLRLLLVGWTAVILLHPSIVLYRVTRDWYDCPCHKQKLK